jgi:hypothetical protein
LVILGRLSDEKSTGWPLEADVFDHQAGRTPTQKLRLARSLDWLRCISQGGLHEAVRAIQMII